MCRRRLSSWTRRAQFPPSNRIFHLSESRIPDRSRGDTATPLITFLSSFLWSSEGLVFSTSLRCVGSQSAVGTAMLASGAPSFVLLASEFPSPPCYHHFGCLESFVCPGELGNGEERECVIGITVVPCGAKIAANLKMGICVKGCGGELEPSAISFRGKMWNMNRSLFSFTLKVWVTLVGATLCLFLSFFSVVSYTTHL